MFIFWAEGQELLWLNDTMNIVAQRLDGKISEFLAVLVKMAKEKY